MHTNEEQQVGGLVASEARKACMPLKHLSSIPYTMGETEEAFLSQSPFTFHVPLAEMVEESILPQKVVVLYQMAPLPAAHT